MRKFLCTFLCGLLMICLAACNDDVPPAKNDGQAARLEAVPTDPVFETENIVRITFYGYYGDGTASVVPDEHMAAIIDWLGSFVPREKVVGMIPPGTNTHFVEIEYADGTIVESGLDTMEIDGVVYYLEWNKEPACYEEIITKSEKPFLKSEAEE